MTPRHENRERLVEEQVELELFVAAGWRAQSQFDLARSYQIRRNRAADGGAPVVTPAGIVTLSVLVLTPNLLRR